MRASYPLSILIFLSFIQTLVFGQGTTIQTISFTSIPNKTTTSPAFTISATAQSGLPVSFAVTSGGTIASVSGNTVTLSGSAGTVTIQATQAGDANFAAATPVSKTFTVSKVSQSISFNTIPTKYINSAPFSISATASSGLPVTYTISGPATISGSTVTLNGTAGTVTIVASQAGNATYNAATSITKSFTVSKLSQTITFATLTSKYVNATPIALSATASSNLAVTYSVTGPATLSGSTLTLTGAEGTVSVTAAQAGNTSYNAATSVTRSFAVTKAPQTITFNTLPNLVKTASPQTLSATSSSGLTISYTVTGPATVSGNTLTLTGTTGTVYVTAAQSGNSVYKAAASVTRSFSVTELANQTISFGTISNKYVNASPITLAATASSGLTVSYSISGPATLSGSTLTLTGTTGTVTVVASQAGNSNYNAAASVTRSFTVSKIDQSITFAALSDKYINSSAFTISSSTTSGLAVTYTISGPATLSGSTVTLTGTTGTVSITASQAGNSVYNAANSITRTFTVSDLPTQTITGFSSIPAKYVNSAPFTISATASSGLPVSFAISGPATLSGSTVTLTGAEGTVTITASQVGNTSYQAAPSVVRTFSVTKVAQTITFPAIANMYVNASSFTIGATASSSLAVSYSISGPATLSGTTVTLTGSTGTVSITATQAGNATYAAALSVVETFTVSNLPTQTITFSTISNKYVDASAFNLSVSASSGLPVSLAISGPATLSGTTVTLTGSTGTVSITASQAGNTSYQAASNVTRTFTVSKRSQTITWATIPQKYINSPDFTVSTTASSGLTTFTYAVVSGPATISGNTVHLTGVSGLVVLSATQAGNSTYNAVTTNKSFTVSSIALREANPETINLLPEISFYPNPVKSQLNINNIDNNSKISILNRNGEVIKADKNYRTSNNTNIDLSDLEKGIYYIRIENENEVKQELFIKE